MQPSIILGASKPTKPVSSFITHYKGEPCLAIRRNRGLQRYRDGVKGPAFLIALSAAWQYRDDEYLMFQALRCAHHLDMGSVTKGEVIAICDTIQNGLDDLVKAKPESLEDATAREKADSPFDSVTGTVKVGEQVIEVSQ